MKLSAEIGKDTFEVEITREGEKVFADVDGRKYELEASEPEPGVLLLKHEGRIYEAVVSEKRGARDVVSVRIGKTEHAVRLIDPKRLRTAGGATEHPDGVAELTTAMPGKVVRILTSVGTAVEKGDGILVVEAMKMQNELKSPKAGIVKEIRVADGAAVAAGDILATIE
ncbi:MAG: biotin/lipoyl-containing protein [Acidobacteriota bacterium]